ncbi:hypothetical protein FRX31_007749 [Thalictrum thalictroides]|uniref:Uncharacterized protein n=1 Tax=Thalictrum thalictroides TaxID=46969 RepID=A0A7J6X008_THATH|nr:hypothetical protein FRX31_007749 [Thalictrum thalictroides]
MHQPPGRVLLHATATRKSCHMHQTLVHSLLPIKARPGEVLFIISISEIKLQHRERMEKFSEKSDSNTVQQTAGSNYPISQTGSSSWRVVKRMEKQRAGSTINVVQQTEDSVNQAYQNGSTIWSAHREVVNSYDRYSSNRPRVQHTEESNNGISQSGSTRSSARSSRRRRRNSARLQQPLSILSESSNHSVSSGTQFDELQRGLAPTDQTPTQTIDELYEHLADEWEDLEREIREACPLAWSPRDGA